MENFNDASLDSKLPLMSSRSQSTSQQDLSSRKDHLRRVYSVPAATPTRTPLVIYLIYLFNNLSVNANLLCIRGFYPS